MLDHYLTIRSDGKHEIIIEKSRFICHIKRIKTESEAQTFIQTIKKEGSVAKFENQTRPL